MDAAHRVGPLLAVDSATLGGYQLVGRLGTDGTGVVYFAKDADCSPVAIKLIDADLAADPEFIDRFRSEADRARQVPPFCTAKFIGADLDHDPPFLVVEYIDGPSLNDVVAERGPLRGDALHSLAVGVATALTGMHGAGVIHRDLKPDNVLLPSGSTKVIDFGIARPPEATSHHTRTDVTVTYLAPEQLSGEPKTPVTSAADVFAWGCVIAYAGTGRAPFLGDSPSATTGRILTQPPRLDGLPESLRAPVLLALAKDPADRPTAPELRAMLLGEKAGSRSLPQTAAEPRHRRHLPPRKRRRLLLPTVLAALLVLAGLTAAGLLRNRDTDPQPASLAPIRTSAAAAPSEPAGSPPAPPALLSASPSPSVGVSAPKTPPTSPSAGPSASTASTASPSAGPSVSTVSASANPTGRNLALGRSATASSSEGVLFGAAEAVDGDPVSRWSSGFSDPQWLIVDLGARWQISEIVLHWERAHAVRYRVEVSTDGRTWQSVYSTSNGQGGAVSITADRVPGRYVRVYCTQRFNEYGYSLFELQVR
ncbi:serine/threonine protein kinase [Micromonospora rubida]|uniref:serine/threonine protein kinase n=1 Tax=Micromonospora rubida TaxID=2697657 RepID=UPI002E2CC789|nr:protein kinase [Micromonospora rubida]